MGMLIALDCGPEVFQRYHMEVCRRFWRRELDIEDAACMRAVALEAGADGATFDRALVSPEVSARCRSIAEEAESKDVFGVPTFVLEDTGELFWGTDRIWLLEERLRELELSWKYDRSAR